MTTEVKTNAADENRAIRLQTIRELDRLLTQASHPKFRGTVGVELSVKNGRFSEPKLIRIQFGSAE